MDGKTLSDLIGLIYDTAHDIRHWQRLTEMLSCELDALAHQEHPVEEERISRSGLIELLRPHVFRAVEFNREIFQAREQQNAMALLLERLPLAMLIVDDESNVLTYNSKAVSLISNGEGISIKNNVLGARSALETTRLRCLISSVANNNDPDGQTIHLSDPDKALPLSALVVPINLKNDVERKAKPRVAVLVAAPETHFEIPRETLKSLYRLTEAEAKLVSSLVKDLSLNAIAEDFGVSIHTVRTQLKSIYEKTGTHRQAELVRHVITGPAMLATISQNESLKGDLASTANIKRASLRQNFLLNQTMTLPDGRLLGFAEYGDPDGHPVVMMHASNGSRLERHPDETIIKRCGVRLIIPDRPGVGLSDGKKRISLLGWTEDVKALVGHLGLNRFSVIGYSVGAAFALACAYELQHRIVRLVLVSGMTPFKSIWELEGMSMSFRLFLASAKYAHWLIEPAAKLFSAQVSTDEQIQDLIRQLPPVDQALFCDATIRERMKENEMENFRQIDHNILPEGLLIAKNWGFLPEDIEVPTEIWHGEQDRLIPPQMVRRFAKRIPNCHTNFLSGAGHYLIYHCWREILLSAI